jgi:hypothetical protein
MGGRFHPPGFLPSRALPWVLLAVSVAAVVYGFVAGNDVMLLLGIVGFGAIVIGYGLSVFVSHEGQDGAPEEENDDREPPGNHR